MAYRPPHHRAEDVKEAQRLRLEHGSVTAVARIMGLPRSTVSDLLNHPERGDTYQRRLRSGGRQYQLCKCGRRKSYGASQCMTCRRA